MHDRMCGNTKTDPSDGKAQLQSPVFKVKLAHVPERFCFLCINPEQLGDIRPDCETAATVMSHKKTSHVNICEFLQSFEMQHGV